MKFCVHKKSMESFQVKQQPIQAKGSRIDFERISLLLQKTPYVIDAHSADGFRFLRMAGDFPYLITPKTRFYFGENGLYVT